MKKFVATTLAICFMLSSASAFAMEDGHHKKHHVKKHHKVKTMSQKHHKFHIKGMPKTGMGGASN
ncbi:hypothetical protein JNUCC42_08910 [Brevibacterium sp. JNUCC-42]|nr:hypothetical protein JNUCC42_08910 [Brevibacterium sp. JNUCC-42]